jgi:hypothetical protein
MVFSKEKLYVLKENLEKPSSLTSHDSLSPFPPECLLGIEYSQIEAIHQTIDRTSLRLYLKGQSTPLGVDFMNEDEKLRILEVLAKSKCPEAENKLEPKFEFNEKPCDYLFNIAIVKSKEQHDPQSFTDYILNNNKRLMVISERSISICEVDFSSSNYE